MIKIKRYGLVCLCFAVLLAFAISPITAFAGSSNVNVADNASVSGKIDEGKWRTTGGVSSVNGKIVFGEDCTDNARITTRNFFKDCSYGGINEVFTASYSLTINSIPASENARFAFASGLKGVGDKLESDGVSEVYFVNDGGTLKTGVRICGDNGKDIIAPKAIDFLSFGTKFNLSVSLVSEGYLTVTVSSVSGETSVICDDATKGNTDHLLEGFISIGQTSVCNVEISSVSITAHDYKNAETPLVVTETFDNDEYNGNAFYTRSDPNDNTGSDGGVVIANNALKFVGRPCFVSTTYSYSNFEMTFDLIDVVRKDVTDENGNVIRKKVNGWFGISLECDTGKGAFDNHARTNALYTMEVTTQESKMYNRLALTDFEQYPSVYKTADMNIADESNEGKVYNFKVVMHDGKFSVSYKLSESENYPEVPLFSKDLGYTPYGSVAIMSYGESGYTIDNIKITNNDYAPKEVGIEYNGIKNRTEPNFAYEDKWGKDDFVTNKIGQTTSASTSGGCNSGLNGGSFLIMAACAAALLPAVTGRRNKRDE